ncbi:MAG: hypothetical protein J5637_04555 [Prevotella sp.]|nr:hypothetical protein [Prevotella sp.]
MIGRLLKKCGLPLLFLGILLLIAGFPTHLCDSNAYLLLCVVLVVGGLVKFVIEQKRRGNY